MKSFRITRWEMLNDSLDRRHVKLRAGRVWLWCLVKIKLSGNFKKIKQALWLETGPRIENRAKNREWTKSGIVGNPDSGQYWSCLSLLRFARFCSGSHSHELRASHGSVFCSLFLIDGSYPVEEPGPRRDCVDENNLSAFESFIDHFIRIEVQADGERNCRHCNT